MTYTEEGIYETEKSLTDIKLHYTAYLNSLYAASERTQEELDKVLITLSTFSIGFLATIRQQFENRSPGFGFPDILLTSIAFFVFCIVMVLFSHFISKIVHDNIINKINHFIDVEETDVVKIQTAINSEHSNSRYIKLANFLSAAAFLLAVAAAVDFFYLFAGGNP